MLKRISLLFLCLALLFPVRVFAQNDLPILVIEVDLWPEYDRASMLVIYRITLAPETTLPAPLRLRIPARVGAMNAVAAKQPDGSLINVPYDLQSAGDWSDLVFLAPTPEIQIEYYDPDLLKDGMRRTFEYRWSGDYAVDMFSMQIQQPLGARDMIIAPSFGSGRASPDGFVYYISDIGKISSGQTFSVNLEYQKETDDLSLTDMPISPSGPINPSPLTSLGLADLLPFILAMTGLVLLVGGGWWYYQSGHDQLQVKPARRRSRRKPVEPETGQIEEGEHVYCHQCGKRAHKGDRFCRVCGTQLRTN